MAFQTYNLPLDNGFRVWNAAAISSATTTNTNAFDLTGSDSSTFSKFAVVLDWSGLTAAGTDTLYRMRVQVSAASGFSTAYTIEERLLGHATAASQPVNTPATGRVMLYCDNVATTSATDPGSLQGMRYVRVQCISAGTTPTITLTGWIVPLP